MSLSLLGFFGAWIGSVTLLQPLRPWFERATRAALDWLAALSRRIPRWTGFILMGLGMWSIWFTLYVPI